MNVADSSRNHEGGTASDTRGTARYKKGKLINQYLKIRKIGEGPYSKIKLMKDINTNKLYAMKKYNLFILKKKNKLFKK